MKWSYEIGSLFGIPIKLHISFLILLFFVGIAGNKYGPWENIIGILSILLIFFCVLLHELAHAKMALHFGLSVKNIVLLPIGGIAHIDGDPKNPGQEIMISIVGPLISLLLALIFYILTLILGLVVSWQTIGMVGGSICANLFWINLILGLFNLLPAFPMDGGRILRGILSLKINHVKATQIAVEIGQICALILFFAGIIYNWWFALIGIFIYLGAEAEEHAVVLRAHIHAIPVKDVMITNMEILFPDMTIEQVLERICHTLQQDFLIVDKEKLVGILTKDLFFAAYKQLAKDTSVQEIMKRDFSTVHPQDSLEDIYKRMIDQEITFIPVTENEKVLGYLSLEQIGKYHMICGLRSKL